MSGRSVARAGRRAECVGGSAILRVQQLSQWLGHSHPGPRSDERRRPRKKNRFLPGIKTFTWCTGAHSSRAFCSGEQGHAPAAAGARESMGWEGGAPKWLLGKLVGHVTSTKMQKTVSLLTHKPRAHCTHTAHAATLPSPSTGPKSVRSSLLAAVFVVDGCHCFPTGCRPNPMALETPQVRAHRP